MGQPLLESVMQCFCNQNQSHIHSLFPRATFFHNENFAFLVSHIENEQKTHPYHEFDTIMLQIFLQEKQTILKNANPPQSVQGQEHLSHLFVQNEQLQ